ncbi:MAG TPA: hypothetical protein VKQ72_17080 [Aggregatilineales bacterium]|nr:hypothetical protein [Aggregatilineales bacterium]
MTTNVLFLCPHNAAKSVFALAYFNQLAQQAGLAVKADSAGTEPDEVISPLVAAMLADEGLDVSHMRPRLITAEDLRKARRIISMGCSPASLGIEPERLELWTDIPNVSQDAEGARRAIRTHVEQVIAELQANS